MNYKENEIISVDEQSLESVEDVDSYIKGAVDGAELKALETSINWKQKLSSRKLWAAIVGVVVGVAMAFGLSENEWSEVAGIVTSAVSVVGYIFGEAMVDATRENFNIYDQINDK